MAPVRRGGQLRQIVAVGARGVGQDVAVGLASRGPPRPARRQVLGAPRPRARSQVDIMDLIGRRRRNSSPLKGLRRRARGGMARQHRRGGRVRGARACEARDAARARATGGAMAPRPPPPRCTNPIRAPTRPGEGPPPHVGVPRGTVLPSGAGSGPHEKSTPSGPAANRPSRDTRASPERLQPIAGCGSDPLLTSPGAPVLACAT